jgi:hypothetical protein
MIYWSTGYWSTNYWTTGYWRTASLSGRIKNYIEIEIN